jgi:flagellin-like protein
MSSVKQDERGFSPVESVLVVVMVAIIGLIGWYVYHSKQNTNKALDAATSTNSGASPRFADNSKKTTANSGDTSNASLQNDLNSVTSASNQGSKDILASNDSLNDKSTLTSVPQ